MGQGPQFEGSLKISATPAAKIPALGIGRPLSRLAHRYAPALDVVFTLFRRRGLLACFEVSEPDSFDILQANFGVLLFCKVG